MPLRKCQYKNRKGYKWGKAGKCYTGKSARSKAMKQARAIEYSKHKK